MKACFIVHFDKEYNRFAAVSRPENDKYGFAGGKVDDGETLKECALREAEEEGWFFYDVEDDPFFWDRRDDGTVCYYFRSRGEFIILSKYKEKYRNILPVFLSFEKIKKQFNNEEVLKHFKCKYFF